MNILSLIKPAFTVLKYGSSLSNTTFWANVGGVSVLLLAVRDAAQAFFPDAALISNDLVANIAGSIAGLVGAYLMYASNKDAGIKLPPIELQSVSEPESPNEYQPKPEYRPKDVAFKHRPISQYVPPAAWLHQPKLLPKPKATPEPDITDTGFGNK